MKATKKIKSDKSKTDTVVVPKSGLIAMVASSLKGKVLFPEKVEQAKRFISGVKVKKA